MPIGEVIIADVLWDVVNQIVDVVWVVVVTIVTFVVFCIVVVSVVFDVLIYFNIFFWFI